MINIVDNHTTLESYKVIATLLEVNPKIVVYFDNPETLYEQQERINNNDLSSLHPQQPVKIEPVPTQESKDLENQNSLDESQEAPMPNKPNRLKLCLQKTQVSLVQNFIALTKAVCCFQTRVSLLCFRKNELRGVDYSKPTPFSLACCWHYWTLKQRVTQFIPQIKQKRAFNRKGIQNLIVCLLVFNQILMVLTATLNFVVPEAYLPTAELGVVGFLAYLWLFENILLLAFNKYVRTNLLNPFLLVQVFHSLLNKAALIGLGHLGGYIYLQDTTPSIVCGVLSIAFILLDQIKTFDLTIKVLSARKDDSVSQMLEHVERTQQVVEVLNYRGIQIALNKISLLSTSKAQKLTQRIAQELNPDLVKAQPKGLARIWEAISSTYNSSVHRRHLFLIDLPLVAILALGLVFNWLDLGLQAFIAAGILLLDIFATFAQISVDKNRQVSIDVDHLWTRAEQRREELADRYVEVLMREKEMRL